MSVSIQLTSALMSSLIPAFHAVVVPRPATRGRIAPGYLADLVVLSADPFDLAALGPDAVDGTVVGGRPVHVTDGLFSVAAG